MTPRVTIVTTVYDRMDCLARCLRATTQSACADHEQLVVSDAPGQALEDAIDGLIAAQADPRVRHLRRTTRANDWGMSPAADGLRAAAGEFVCFLSDDNAYLPNHFSPLVDALDRDPDLGFVYASCQYAAFRELRTAPPAGSQIDLGQPLFRTTVLRTAFPHGFPFQEFAWDWRVIHVLLLLGVRWQHIDTASFIFRLAAYPEHLEALR
jgi:glycosyltransferase involved in cell wall biosynthesis